MSLKVSLSPAYHPQTNGECENRNRTLKSRLKLACKLENWDLFLPEAIHQMNSAKHSVTKVSPFQIETGYPGENPNDKYRTTQNRREVNLENIEEKIQNNHNKRQSDNEQIHLFKVNDLVLCKNTSPLEKIFKWIGPMRITGIRKQSLSFTLLNLESGRILTRHISHIKPFIQREENEETTVQPNAEPQNDKNNASSQKKRQRISYTITTRSIARNLNIARRTTANTPVQPTVPTTNQPSIQPTVKSTVLPTVSPTVESTILPSVQLTVQPTVQSTAKSTADTQEPSEQESTNRTNLTIDFVDNQQNEPCTTITPDSNPENETIFYDCSTPTSVNDDNQSTDSNGSEVESLTNRMDAEPKPRKLISPIVQRIEDLHDRALDKFIKDYKCNIKMPTWSTLQNKKTKKLEKINEWIRLNHPD